MQPSSLVLGSGETVSVLVRLPRPDLALRAASNAGELRPVAEPPGAERHFTWTPPRTRFPMTALLVFWTEERGAPPAVSVARLPLSGRTSLEIQTEPAALVRVQVAGATFGPQRADRRGRVEVPIDVPPGVREAQVLAEAQGRTTTRAAALAVPGSGNPAVAISPDPAVRGEPCWLIVAHPDAFEPEQLGLELSGGRWTLESREPERALYRIDADDGAEEIAASVWLGDRAERAQVRTRIASAGDVYPEPAPLAGRRFSASATAGGFYAGGANSGAALAIDGSYALPAAADRLSLDLELGYRSSSLSAPVAGLGLVRSSISALSIELALRALVFERGAWTLHGRVGGGILPFQVSAHSDFQPPFTQSAVAVEAFAAAQIGHRLRPVELFAELRGGIAPARTSTINARLGGLLFALGARYPVR